MDSSDTRKLLHRFCKPLVGVCLGFSLGNSLNICVVFLLSDNLLKCSATVHIFMLSVCNVATLHNVLHNVLCTSSKAPQCYYQPQLLISLVFCLRAGSVASSLQAHAQLFTLYSLHVLIQCWPNKVYCIHVCTACRLSVYSSESMEDGTKKCLSSVKFGDAITSLQWVSCTLYKSSAWSYRL